VVVKVAKLEEVSRAAKAGSQAAVSKAVVKVAKLEEVSRAAKAGSQAAANKVVVKVAKLEEVSRAAKVGSQAAVSKADRLVKTAERNRTYVIRCRDSILGTILKQPYIQEA
jgi:rRNA-processing protein FCF1